MKTFNIYSRIDHLLENELVYFHLKLTRSKLTFKKKIIKNEIIKNTQDKFEAFAIDLHKTYSSNPILYRDVLLEIKKKVKNKMSLSFRYEIGSFVILGPIYGAQHEKRDILKNFLSFLEQLQLNGLEEKEVLVEDLMVFLTEKQMEKFEACISLKEEFKRSGNINLDNFDIDLIGMKLLIHWILLFESNNNQLISDQVWNQLCLYAESKDKTPKTIKRYIQDAQNSNLKINETDQNVLNVLKKFVQKED